MTYKIDDLRDHPEFARIVAERVWAAWWRRHGHPLEHLISLVDLNLNPASSIPFALVAHRNGRFLGTVSVIASDMEARPNLSPWVAALWVDSEYRREGVGSSLTRKATETAFALGYSPVYLCAAPS